MLWVRARSAEVRIVSLPGGLAGRSLESKFEEGKGAKGKRTQGEAGKRLVWFARFHPRACMLAPGCWADDENQDMSCGRVGSGASSALQKREVACRPCLVRTSSHDEPFKPSPVPFPSPLVVTRGLRRVLAVPPHVPSRHGLQSRISWRLHLLRRGLEHE